MILFQSAISLLEQLQKVNSQLSNQQFTQPLEVLSGNTIGQHMRHTLEFFLCLMDGDNFNEINYDNRKHDNYLETDIRLTRKVTESVIEFLRSHPSDRPIHFVANYSLQSDNEVRIPSSLHREIAYNIEHAIHHMALIKIGIKALDQDFDLPVHFGVASSTVRYRETH